MFPLLLLLLQAYYSLCVGFVQVHERLAQLENPSPDDGGDDDDDSPGLPWLPRAETVSRKMFATRDNFTVFVLLAL